MRNSPRQEHMYVGNGWVTYHMSWGCHDNTVPVGYSFAKQGARSPCLGLQRIAPWWQMKPVLLRKSRSPYDELSRYIVFNSAELETWQGMRANKNGSVAHPERKASLDIPDSPTHSNVRFQGYCSGIDEWRTTYLIKVWVRLQLSI